MSILKKPQLGQSLIEVLTALAVVLLVIIALIRATTTSMKGSDFAKTQSSATSYGQEAIEWIRAERDKNWDNIADKVTPGKICLNALDWTATAPCNEDSIPLAGKFQRQVILSSVGTEGKQIKVEVTVSWQDSSGEHQSVLTTYLSNWR